MSNLKLDVKIGDVIEIGDGVTVTLEKKSGSAARLSFTAPEKVRIRKRDKTQRVARPAAINGISVA